MAALAVGEAAASVSRSYLALQNLLAMQSAQCGLPVVLDDASVLALGQRLKISWGQNSAAPAEADEDWGAMTSATQLPTEHFADFPSCSIERILSDCEPRSARSGAFLLGPWPMTRPTWARFLGEALCGSVH
jgi:hypothetical protein